MSVPPQKRQRLSEEQESAAGSDNEVDDLPSDDGESGSGISEDVSDEEDILNMRPTKSQQTKKRKIRATRASNFGSTLQFLLNTEAPSDLPLSLKPSLARKRNDEKLESKAKKALQQERRDREDKNRITDVIGGWGGESERALRKVAQRGGTFSRFYADYVLNFFAISGETLQRCTTVSNCCYECGGSEESWQG